MITLVKRLVCHVFEHDWRLVRIAQNLVVFSEHDLTGCDADCRRCGARWRDVERQLGAGH